VTSAKQECYKRFCSNCQENKDIGHLCYMRPLKDTLPAASDKVLYVFYDIETTPNTEYEEESKLHVPNLVCAQQFCRDARTWKTETARYAVGGSTLSGKIP